MEINIPGKPTLFLKPQQLDSLDCGNIHSFIKFTEKKIKAGKNIEEGYKQHIGNEVVTFLLEQYKFIYSNTHTSLPEGSMSSMIINI